LATIELNVSLSSFISISATKSRLGTVNAKLQKELQFAAVLAIGSQTNEK
jgi:hypothetical protein